MKISMQPTDNELSSRLTVKLFEKEIISPLILGSGTLVERYEDIEAFLLAGIGAVVPRSTRKVMERQSHPVPHLYNSGSKKYPIMINAEWTGADINYWRPYLERLSENKKIIMSISGRDIEGCVELCKELGRYPGWLYFEINVSCAHSNNVHGMITRNEKHIADLVSAIKDTGINTPIAIKLGHSDDIVYLSDVAKRAGADAIVAINTYGPVFDFYIDEFGQPKPTVGIKEAKGGLSGAPLFQIALTDIAEIRRQLGITVIGCGGAVSVEDVIKMLMAGASAVQIYTAAHVRGVRAPNYFSELNSELLKFMDNYGIDDLNKIIGKALPLLDQQTNMDVHIPKLIESRCIGCDLCIPICLPSAISKKNIQGINKLNHVVEIDHEKCIGCGHCIHVCPTNPNALSF